MSFCPYEFPMAIPWNDAPMSFPARTHGKSCGQKLMGSPRKTHGSISRGVARNLIWVGINGSRRQNNHTKKFKVD